MTDKVPVVVHPTQPVSVVMTERGPKGDPGPPGDEGPPGEGDTTPDIAFASATWRYNTTLTPPPASGTFRSPSQMTTIWINDLDQNGYDRSFGIAKIATDDVVMLRFDTGRTAILQATAAPTDNGTYWTVPVKIISGAPEDDRGKMALVTVFVSGLEPPKVGGGL